jgi:hypothetical protein
MAPRRTHKPRRVPTFGLAPGLKGRSIRSPAAPVLVARGSRARAAWAVRPAEAARSSVPRTRSDRSASATPQDPTSAVRLDGGPSVANGPSRGKSRSARVARAAQPGRTLRHCPMATCRDISSVNTAISVRRPADPQGLRTTGRRSSVRRGPIRSRIRAVPSGCLPGPTAAHCHRPEAWTTTRSHRPCRGMPCPTSGPASPGQSVSVDPAGLVDQPGQSVLVGWVGRRVPVGAMVPTATDGSPSPYPWSGRAVWVARAANLGLTTGTTRSRGIRPRNLVPRRVRSLVLGTATQTRPTTRAMVDKRVAKKSMRGLGGRCHRLGARRRADWTGASRPACR